MSSGESKPTVVHGVLGGQERVNDAIKHGKKLIALCGRSWMPTNRDRDAPLCRGCANALIGLLDARGAEVDRLHAQITALTRK